MLSRVAVVGCSKAKTVGAGPAVDVYGKSRLFRLSLQWGRTFCGDVLIASTKLGIVRPDDWIEPYDLTFARNGGARPSPNYMRQWGVQVAQELDAYGKAIVFLCGESYHSLVTPYLSLPYEVPLQGLSMGARMSRLAKDLEP